MSFRLAQDIWHVSRIAGSLKYTQCGIPLLPFAGFAPARQNGVCVLMHNWRSDLYR